MVEKTQAPVSERQLFWDRQAYDWAGSYIHPIRNERYVGEKIQCFLQDEIGKQYLDIGWEYYDKFHRLRSPRSIAKLSEQDFKDSWATKPKILDVASGGGFTRYLHNRYLRLNTVVSMDISSEMLQMARRNEPKYHKRVMDHKVVADCESPYPFADNTFEAAVSMFGFRYFKDQANVAREILRVLKPGGKLVIVDMGRNNHKHEVSEFDPQLLMRNREIPWEFTSVQLLHEGSSVDGGLGFNEPEPDKEPIRADWLTRAIAPELSAGTRYDGSISALIAYKPTD